MKVGLELDPEQWWAYCGAAEREGVPLRQWVARSLDAAAAGAVVAEMESESAEQRQVREQVDEVVAVVRRGLLRRAHAVPELVRLGLTDAVIVERLGMDSWLVGEARRAAGLKPNRQKRSGRRT